MLVYHSTGNGVDSGMKTMIVKNDKILYFCDVVLRLEALFASLVESTLKENDGQVLLKSHLNYSLEQKSNSSHWQLPENKHGNRNHSCQYSFYSS